MLYGQTQSAKENDLLTKGLLVAVGEAAASEKEEGMSLTREAIIKWRDYARRDLESAPADGMLVYLIESVPETQPGLWDRRQVEIIATAYAKVLQEYVRP